MKSFTKGVLTGLLIGGIIFSAPVLADDVFSIFNTVRVNVNGVDRVQWGDEVKLDNGNTVPSSIIYKDTTYLPLRKISSLCTKKIYWNGDSRTVYLSNSQSDKNTITEKPDKTGNIWTYYTFKSDGHDYLGIKDTQRGFERIYRLAGAKI